MPLEAPWKGTASAVPKMSSDSAALAAEGAFTARVFGSSYLSNGSSDSQREQKRRTGMLRLRLCGRKRPYKLCSA